MDKDEVKFLLASFRPDGADTGDRDFEEALKAATEDRELCEWFAAERAADSEIARALGTVAAPAGLRDRILAVAQTDFSGVPQAETLQDARMIGAVASVQAPAELRGRILTAMERSAADKPVQISWWRKAAWPIAAAAGVAFAFLLTWDAENKSDKVIVLNPRVTVPVDVVEASFIRNYESNGLTFDEDPKEHGLLMSILEKKKLPCPKYLPKGLVGVKGEGCRELEIDGKRGSLVCFNRPGCGPVNLVIFNRSDVCGELPTRDRPALTQNGPWAVARWVDGGYVFVLLGSTQVEKLAELF